ncbi:MAG: phage tail protein [Sterolibacterium sp.]
MPYLNAAVILGVWSHGECDSVVSTTINDLSLGAPTIVTTADYQQCTYSNGVEVKHYWGTATQATDALLGLAFTANGKTYTDTLPNICYSVFFIPFSAYSSFPRINCIIKGRKVATGSAGTTIAWSDNPAYCLADFITNTTYGCKRTVNWASVYSVSQDCDAIVGGTEKIRTLNLALTTVQPVSAWLETLRTYAACWLIPSGTDLKFVSDKAGSSIATIAHASGQIKSVANVKKRGVQSTPTLMIVEYTDTAVLPYKVSTATVDSGVTPRRESKVSLPGINRYSQAVREATERLNKLLLNDLSLNIEVFDERLDLDVGDIVTVTHPIGLTSKLLRVLGITGGYGRYGLALLEYDPAVYDATVATTPTWSDTTMPNPLSAVDAPTSLVINEELYETRDYSYASRFAITWTASVDAYPLRYFVTISDPTHIVNSGYVLGAAYTFGPLMDGITYTVNVYAERESTQVRSTALSDTKAAVGNAALPANVANFALIPTDTGSRLIWDAVTNVDLAGYDLQLTAVWNPALTVYPKKIQYVDLDALAAATYEFSIKAVNFSGNVSATEGAITYVATVPATPTLTGNVYFNAVVLSWGDCRTTNPLTHFSVEVTKDTVFLEDRAVYGNLRTVTYFETATGSYAYRVRAHDYYVPGTYSNTVTLSVVAGTPVTVVDAADDATTWLMLAGTQTGAQSPLTDGALTYNAATNTLTLPSVSANSLTVSPGGTTLAHLTVNDDPIFVGSTGFNAAGEMARVKVGDANFGVGSKYGTGMSLYVPKTAGGSAYNTNSIDAISISETTGAVTLASTLSAGATSVTTLVASSGATQISGTFQNTDTSNISYIQVRDKDGKYANLGRDSATQSFLGYSDNLRIGSGTGTSIGITDAGAVTIPVSISVGTTAGSYSLNGQYVITKDGTNTAIYDHDGAIALYLGKAAAPVNYYDNTSHIFRGRGGAAGGNVTIGGTLGVTGAISGTTAILAGDTSSRTNITFDTNNVLDVKATTNSTTVLTTGVMNPRLMPAGRSTIILGAAEINSPTGFFASCTTTSPRVTTGDGASTASQCMTGASIYADANATLANGETQRSVWGLNVTSRVGPGAGNDPTGKTAADDHCGIEVDLINEFKDAVQGDPLAVGHSYGFWAQADTATGRLNGTAFMATRTGAGAVDRSGVGDGTVTGSGWRNILYADSYVTDNLAYLKTSATAANGLYIGIPTGSTGYPLLLQKNSSNIFVVDASGNTTVVGKTSTSASTTTRAGLNVAHGAAPSTPADGDVWTTTAGLFAQVNGATKTVALGAAGSTYTPTLSTGTNVTAVSLTASKDFVVGVIDGWVEASGCVDATFTASGTYSYFDVTLPYTAADAAQIFGSGAGIGSTCWPVFVDGASTTVARVKCYPTDSGAKAISLSFRYRK